MQITNNYTNNYNVFQLKLPLEIETIIPNDDILYSFVDLIRKVNLNKYITQFSRRRNDGYNPTMMLEVILFAFTNQIYSLRKIEQACKTDTRFIYLTNGATPSHQAFSRFINSHLLNNIEDIFYDINHSIIDIEDINTDILYIDGTKFEANARKTSFVWKKAVLSFRSKLYLKISKTINSINLILSSNYSIQDSYSSEFVTILEKNLLDKIDKDGLELVYGKGKRKSELQRVYDDIVHYNKKLLEYNDKLVICGSRNSYSKVDNDATFMNMKYDYYNHTGVFKAGYNIQIGVSDEYIMCADVFQNPADTKTFIPFMEKYKNNYLKLPKYPVGDAGYGSYDNYCYCLKNNMELSLKYNYFNKVNYDKRFKKKLYHSINLKKLADGTRVCPMNHPFDIYVGYSKSRETIYPKVNQIFECSECFDCPSKPECTKSKNNRKVSINYKQDEMHALVDKLLTSEQGLELRKQRSIQTEGAFGVIKEDFKYDRIHRRNKESVKTEILLVCIGFNIKKYHNKKKRKKLS